MPTTSTNDHLTDEALALFVAGEPSDVDDAALREHLRTCASCEARLRAEAVLEHDLWRLRQSAGVCVSCGRSTSERRCGHCGAALRAGSFRVVRLIAESDHGRMYEAVGEADGQRVALKELVFSRIPDVETLRSLEREGETLRSLDRATGIGASVPRFVASFHEGEGVNLRCYLAQELVVGRSLADLVSERRFDEREVRRIGVSLLEVLAALQRTSPPLLHRDIKPANVLVRDDGTLVIVDFGSARTTKGTANATLVGTFGYMPAEQLAGIVDTSTDVHAVGATLVHLLTQRPPWEVLVDRARIALPATSSFIAVLERMLAPHGERYRDAATALAALRDVPAALPKRPSHGALSMHGARAAPTKTLLAAAVTAGTVLLGAAILIVAYAMTREPPTPPTPPTPPLAVHALTGGTYGTLTFEDRVVEVSQWRRILPGGPAGEGGVELIIALRADGDEPWCRSQLLSRTDVKVDGVRIDPTTTTCTRDDTTASRVRAELRYRLASADESQRIVLTTDRSRSSVLLRHTGIERTPASLGLPRDVVVDVIQEHEAAAHACLSADPSLAGASVPVRWRVSAEGAVQDVAIAGHDSMSKATAKCIVATIGSWRFPSSSGESRIEYTFAGPAGD